MLVLASASPRRRELLSQAGLTFTVDPANTSEEPLENEAAADYVCRVAEEKARAVYGRLSRSVRPEDEPLLVIGADTCVLLDGSILGKPSHVQEARSMLQSLAGRTHQVLTGVAVMTRAGATVGVEITQVTFDLIAADEMESYLAGGEPLDKAGGYGIQGYAARWIPRIEGCYFNVVGLPIARTLNLLTEARSQLTAEPQDPESTNVVV